ncbi:MAG: hypothetical protein M3Q10_05555 [Chloroflexota bacterium]|nr:hypothetical protein [Chloroflexota bacterium]
MATGLRNIDVLAKDPRTPIPNQGVSKVGRPATPDEWAVLRFELQNFVCEGEYARGLERVLGAYLANGGGSDQVGVWVSGFYGSGKSHFVRVLDALWADLQFPDGARARSLVPPLPPEIAAHFVELSRRGERTGGVWSASGILSSGAGSFRLAVLAVLFEAAGLPAGYGPAKFVLWLKRQKIEEPVRGARRDGHGPRTRTLRPLRLHRVGRGGPLRNARLRLVPRRRAGGVPRAIPW